MGKSGRRSTKGRESIVKRTVGLMFLVVLFSCNQRTELSDAEKDRIIGEVREMLQDYDDDVRKNGLMAEFAYLDSSDDFFWVAPGYSSPLSYDSVASIVKENSRKFRSVDNSWKSLRIFPHSKALATFTGEISSTMIDTSGTVLKVSLLETGLAIKRSDGWNLLSGQTTVLSSDD